MACRVSCVEAVRYAGNDPAILARFRELGCLNSCDFLPREIMSKTLFVEYRDAGFWAYDVAVGIFLKHVIDAARKCAEGEDAAWLRDCIDQWRVNAITSDLGLHLDEGWSNDQVGTIICLIEEAC